jgi:glycosyltransferase involved in cell wall biosynthesis
MSQQGKKLNIAIFHPSLMNRGGSQRYAIETAIHLRNHGYNVDLITSKFSPDKCYPELLANFPVSSVHTYSSADSINSSLRSKRSLMYYLLMITGLYALVRVARDWMQNRKVASLISRLEHQNNAYFDILYLHESTSFNYLAKCLNSARRRVYLFCYDTPDKFLSWELEGLRLPWIHASIERLRHMRDKGIVRAYIEKIFVLDSTMLKKCKIFYGITPAIIYGGIDLTTFNSIKSNFLIERYKLPEKSLIISNVSRFVPYRRLHDIFEAFSQINIDDKSKIFIYINAYNQDQRYTYELLNKYKDVIFPRGNVIVDHEFPSSDSELAQIYKSSNGFIFPNENQTWGNAVLEAMACGVCVMVSDSCGISEIVNHGDDGLIYRCGDITAISAFILRIARQRHDSALIGLRAAEHIETNFSWKVWIDNHLVYFEQQI